MNQTLIEDDFCFSRRCEIILDHCVTVIYYCLAPLYVVLAFGGHLVLLIAMLMQDRRQHAYVYQILVVINGLLLDASVTVYTLCWVWLGKYQWFLNNYFCMWFTAQLSILLPNVFCTCLMFMSLVVAADRLAAMLRPIDYKSFNHRPWQMASMPVCLSLSILINLFDCYRYLVIVCVSDQCPARYSFAVDATFISGAIATGLSHFRSTIRLIVGFALIVVNIVLVHSYRKFRRKTDVSLARRDTKQNRFNQRTLVLMTSAQCASSLFMASVLSAFYGLQYSRLSTCECLVDIAATVTDLSMMCSEIVNFYFCLIFSKTFRTMIRDSVRVGKASILGYSSRVQNGNNLLQ